MPSPMAESGQSQKSSERANIVRFTPDRDRCADISNRQVCANSGHRFCRALHEVLVSPREATALTELLTRGEIDLCVTLREAAEPDLPVLQLYRDRYLCVARARVIR
jgi:hypothetical protein